MNEHLSTYQKSIESVTNGAYTFIFKVFVCDGFGFGKNPLCRCVNEFVMRDGFGIL